MPRPAEELYDVTRDPDCVHNLAADSRRAERKHALRAEMERLLRQKRDPRMLGNAAIFDTYQYTGRSGHSYDAWLKQQGP